MDMRPRGCREPASTTPERQSQKIARHMSAAEDGSPPGSPRTLAEAEELLEEECGGELWERFRGDAGEEGRVVWPEPGCYHPTFSAPYHRIRMMSDAFPSTLLAWLEDGGDYGAATLFSQSVPDGRLGVESRIEAQVRW